jgi:hypothetical protein
MTVSPLAFFRPEIWVALLQVGGNMESIWRSTPYKRNYFAGFTATMLREFAAVEIVEIATFFTRRPTGVLRIVEEESLN